MIGTGVGDVGEREFQNQTTGRFAKSTGSYRALTEAAEFEYVPIKNFRAEFSAVAASDDIGGVAGFDDLRQTGVQGRPSSTGSIFEAGADEGVVG
jgi:hypothetical protein